MLMLHKQSLCTTENVFLWLRRSSTLGVELLESIVLSQSCYTIQLNAQLGCFYILLFVNLRYLECKKIKSISFSRRFSNPSYNPLFVHSRLFYVEVVSVRMSESLIIIVIASTYSHSPVRQGYVYSNSYRCYWTMAIVATHAERFH